jgi:hypothetical protein
MRALTGTAGVALKVAISIAVLVVCSAGRLLVSDLAVVPAAAVRVHPMHWVIYWSTCMAVTAVLPGTVMASVQRIRRTPSLGVTPRGPVRHRCSVFLCIGNAGLRRFPAKLGRPSRLQ